jgi:hypothetical protein
MKQRCNKRLSNKPSNAESIPTLCHTCAEQDSGQHLREVISRARKLVPDEDDG